MERRSAVGNEIAVSLATVIGIAASLAHGSVIRSPTLVEDAQRQLRAALFEAAERTFREALALDAQSAPAHLGLAQTLTARRELNQALAEAEVAAQLSPGNPESHLAMASIHDQSGDPREATAALDHYFANLTNTENRERRLRAQSYRAFLHLAGREPLRVIESRKVVTVPFVIAQDKVVLKVSVAGRIPTDFVLDTGAEHLVLSERTVARVGLRRVGGGGADYGPEMTLVDRLEIAGVTVRRAPAIIRRDPLRVVPNRTGDAFSPIALGLSMIIDYERRELTVGRRLPFEPAEVELPLHVLGLPVIVGRSSAGPVSFVIDTGADATAVSESTIAQGTVAARARQIPMKLFDVWGTRQTDAYLVTPGIDLAFGALRLREYPVIVRSWPEVTAVHGFEMGGILGHDFLRRYRVTIDLVRRVVGFKRQRPERPIAARYPALSTLSGDSR